MTTPHPANNTSSNSTLPIFLWRYLSGHHLDGSPRTNATWFRKGTTPSHHVNWWSAKPRFHRMLWRWATIIIPVGWFFLYRITPTYYINVTVVVTIAWLPYIIHHGMSWLVSKLPRHTVVYVHDNVLTEDVDNDLDNIAIPEQFYVDDVQGELDRAVVNIEDDTKTYRRQRRST
jgi:hypothetical protein